MFNSNILSTLSHLSASNTKEVGVNLFSCKIERTTLFCNFYSLFNCCSVQHVYNIVDPYSKCGFSIVLYILIDVNFETLFLNNLKKPIFFPTFPHIYCKYSFSFKSYQLWNLDTQYCWNFQLPNYLFQMNY